MNPFTLALSNLTRPPAPTPDKATPGQKIFCACGCGKKFIRQSSSHKYHPDCTVRRNRDFAKAYVKRENKHLRTCEMCSSTFASLMFRKFCDPCRTIRDKESAERHAERKREMRRMAKLDREKE